MIKKIYSILLIITFITVINKPLLVMTVIYLNETAEVTEKCCCENTEKQTAKMASNGDAYLKALLKRVCKDTKKNSPKIPSISITVFVKNLINEYYRAIYLQKNDTEISKFVLLKEHGEFIMSLLKPPSLSYS